MNDLHRALGDIRNIRRQVAQSTEFRGYGPLTLAATAACALAAGFVQSLWVVQPQLHPARYAVLWSLTAIVSITLIAVQALTRTQCLHSSMADEMIRMAAEQFLPAAITGALLTIVVVRMAPQHLWLLPSLWQIVYSLGVFSSCRFLPRATLAVGAWYLLTGLTCLALGDARAFAPVLMAGAFGIGQSLVAGILYLAARSHDKQEPQ